MPMFYVPLENTKAPSHLAWTILEYDLPRASDAMQAASLDFRKLGRHFVVWAAVRDCPTFEHMRELRQCFGRTSKKNFVRGYV